MDTLTAKARNATDATLAIGASHRIVDSRRLVIKIGSALLVDEDGGTVRRAWLDALADDIADLRRAGVEVAGRLLRRHRPRPPPSRHRPRSAPSSRRSRRPPPPVRSCWPTPIRRRWPRHHLTVAQILLSPDDTEQRRRHLNARATINTLLALGAVPVINENDTVATAEIRFGDNDRLGARVAQMASADTLVLLSDIDGLYTADPRRNPDARHIADVAGSDRRDRGDGRRPPAAATPRAAW
ncbi:MAG: hypothetical protein ACMVO3_00745 [Thalassobaculum sp.]